MQAIERYTLVYSTRKQFEEQKQQHDKSHALYVRAKDKTTRFLISELCGRLRGTTGIMEKTEEKREMKLYTSLDRIKMKDLLDDGSETTPPAATPATPGTSSTVSPPPHLSNQNLYEIAELEKFLGKHYKDIQKIFRAYGALGSGAASSISRGEFSLLLKDIKIYGK